MILNKFYFQDYPFKEANYQKLQDLIGSKEVVEGVVTQVIAKGILLDYKGFEILIPFAFAEKELSEKHG